MIYFVSTVKSSKSKFSRAFLKSSAACGFCSDQDVPDVDVSFNQSDVPIFCFKLPSKLSKPPPPIIDSKKSVKNGY